MKKMILKFVAAAMSMSLLLTSCGGGGGGSASTATGAGEASEGSKESNTLVIYASTPEDFLTEIVSGFEAETGIKVELVEAGTGELTKRIEAEGENPLGDIMLGGMVSSGYLPQQHLFEEYYSANEDHVLPEYRNETGKVTSLALVPSVLMVNNDLIGDIEIKGYADLLNPELKGKIAIADPSKASSAWEHLINMLYDMGEGDPEAGWEFVDKFMENIEGKLLQGSANVHKGVADGEYAVGLIYEAAVHTYKQSGANVDMVFMEEGVVVQVDGVAIIKNAKNKENAKKFIDFITSKEFQEKMIEAPLLRRPVRDDVGSPEGTTPTEDINQMQIDPEYVAEKKEEILDKFKDIATEY